MVTDSYLTGFYYKPRIDRELIEKYKNDLICIAPSFSGDISQALKSRNTEKAKEMVSFYKKIYGQENFFLEITRHPEIEGHEAIMQQVIKLARETDTPLVAGHDVYYLYPEDREARETMMLINTSQDMSERSDEEVDFSFITPERASELFRDIPEALQNTIKIADMCDLNLGLGKWYFPDFIVESGLSHDDELRRLAYEGISERGLEKTKKVIKPLK